MSKDKFITKSFDTREELVEWLNQIIKQYPYFEEPVFSRDLCGAIIHVWTREEAEK